MMKEYWKSLEPFPLDAGYAVVTRRQPMISDVPRTRTRTWLRQNVNLQFGYFSSVAGREPHCYTSMELRSHQILLALPYLL